MKPTTEDYRRLDAKLEAIGTVELNRRILGEDPEAKDSDSVEIVRLAGLSLIDYDRCREEAAKKLDIRVTTLDREVEKFRPEKELPEGQGAAVLFDKVLTWPDAVNGSELLNDLVETIKRFVVLPTHAVTVAALWVLHTHAHDAATISPILAVESPEKRCGKTTLLSLLKALVRRPLSVSNITTATLFRATEIWKPSLLIDEADSFLRDNEELRGILNSGHVRDSAAVIRSVGDDFQPRMFSTWAPKAIALIGNLPSTLTDRSIVIQMRRKRPDERVDRLRLDRLTQFEDLRRQCTRWTADNSNRLRSSDPDTPRELHDRAADNWRCLLAIADLAGKDWPEKARAAAVMLADSDLTDESAAVMLLADIQDLFQERDQISSSDMVESLVKMEERPWPEWKKGRPITARQIARLLKPFDIRPVLIREVTAVYRGYRKNQFDDAFTRYLPAGSVTPLQVNDFNNLDDNRSVTQKNPVTDREACNSLIDKDCNTVTDEKGGKEDERYLEVDEIVIDQVQNPGTVESAAAERRDSGHADGICD